MINGLNINVQLNLSNNISQQFALSIEAASLESHKSKWFDIVNSEIGPSVRDNKRRTYRKFKYEFKTE